MTALWPILNLQGMPEGAGPDRGWFTGDHLVALATVVAAVIAAAVAISSYRAEHQRARNERFARAFAEAVQAVEDYLEAPYRIRRRPPRDPGIRFQLTGMVSDMQSRIAFHEAWLTTLSPTVAEKYRDLARSARQEAGPQMSAAWRARPTSADSQVPLGEQYEHPLSDAAKAACLTAMRWELTPKHQLRRRRALQPASSAAARQ